jgi:hypothetical protein
MTKYRFARLTLVFGLPAVAAIACSGSSTLPPASTGSDGGNGSGTGATSNQGGGSQGGNTPGVGTGGSGNKPSSGGTTSSFGGYPATGGTASNPTGGVNSSNPTGGAATGTCPGSGSLTMKAGGFVTGSGWSGYGWTAATPKGTSTASPVDFSTCPAATTALCASGNVAAMSDYSGTGMIGLNLNQAEGSSTTGSYTPTGSGVTVNVTNSGGSAVRVQIQAPGGDTDATKRWCATLTTFGSPVTIPWSSFNTKCWDGSGTAYTAGTALQAVIILVPGGNSAAVSWNLCLNSVSF